MGLALWKCSVQSIGKFSILSTLILNRLLIPFDIAKFQADLSRVFSVKNRTFKLNKTTVDTLKYYNKSPNCKNDENVDNDFVQLLLVSFVSVNDLKSFKIDQDVLQLIKGMFLLGVNNVSPVA